MALDTAQVTSRANSDLCNVALMLEDYSLEPAVRMEMIALYADGYKNAVKGSVGQLVAQRIVKARFALQWRIAQSAGLR